MTPTSQLTAHLRGGAGDGRVVPIPLEQLPADIEYKTESGTVPYQRVGSTAEYRPVTVLDALAPAGKPASKRAPRKKGGAA